MDLPTEWSAPTLGQFGHMCLINYLFHVRLSSLCSAVVMVVLVTTLENTMLTLTDFKDCVVSFPFCVSHCSRNSLVVIQNKDWPPTSMEQPRRFAAAAEFL